MTATTTGERDGILSEPRLLLAVPMPPVPPQPEPAKADAPRKGSKAWAIQEACRIVGIAFHGIAEYDEASDCFCSESPHQDYRNDGKALAFVEAAVKEKLARENAPAPPAEAPPERDALGRLCVDGLPHSWATDPSGARFCGVCQHPPAEAKGEMSREELEGTLWLLSDEKGRDGTGAREVRTILAAFDSLRTRARAAEYKAEALERVIREAEEARRMIAGVQPDDRAALAVNILRAWPRAEIETFARHLLGDREQESLLLGQLQTQLEIVTRERDEAREQREDLANEILAERSDLAAANARAEEAERALKITLQSMGTVTEERDSERAARVKAEAELADLRRDVAEEVVKAERRLGKERNDALERLAAAEAEVKRRDEYPHPCLICFGTRPHSGKPCACGGTNNVYKAIEYAMDAWAKGEVREEGYIREAAALRARVARLEEAGDAIVEYVAPHGLGRKLRSDWAAAKAALDAPAGSEAKR